MLRSVAACQVGRLVCVIGGQVCVLTVLYFVQPSCEHLASDGLGTRRPVIWYQWPACHLYVVMPSGLESAASLLRLGIMQHTLAQAGIGFQSWTGLRSDSRCCCRLALLQRPALGPAALEAVDVAVRQHEGQGAVRAVQAHRLCRQQCESAEPTLLTRAQTRRVVSTAVFVDGGAAPPVCLFGKGCSTAQVSQQQGQRAVLQGRG